MGLGSPAAAGQARAKSEGKSSQPSLGLQVDAEKAAPQTSAVARVSPDKPQDGPPNESPDKSQDKLADERLAYAAIQPIEQVSVEPVSLVQAAPESAEARAPEPERVPEGVAAVKSAGAFPEAHGDHEVVKPTLAESPSAKMRASRGPQESLLSLETTYAVDFFSSAPPPVHHVVEPSMQFELEDLPSRSRSALPPEEQLERLKYFRTIVVRVMLVALALFVFALYVLWRRGTLS